MRFCKIRCRPVIAQGGARIRRAVVDEQLQRNLRIGDDILATVSSTRRGTPRFPRKYTRHMATIDAGRYHKKPYPAENGSVRMQTMSSAQILSSLFYIYVYMRQEIKQWTNRKTYAKMDKKEGYTVKRDLLADRLKGMRAFWCCSAMCSAACAQQASPPPPFSSASNGFCGAFTSTFLYSSPAMFSASRAARRQRAAVCALSAAK